MHKKLLDFVILAVMGAAATATLIAQTDTQAVTVVHRASARRVDVSIDGKPFTSYIYPAFLQKPVLYPIRSAQGAIVTRGYPLDRFCLIP